MFRSDVFFPFRGRLQGRTEPEYAWCTEFIVSIFSFEIPQGCGQNSISEVDDLGFTISTLHGSDS